MCSSVSLINLLSGLGEHEVKFHYCFLDINLSRHIKIRHTKESEIFDLFFVAKQLTKIHICNVSQKVKRYFVDEEGNSILTFFAQRQENKRYCAINLPNPTVLHLSLIHI